MLSFFILIYTITLVLLDLSRRIILKDNTPKSPTPPTFTDSPITFTPPKSIHILNTLFTIVLNLAAIHVSSHLIKMLIPGSAAFLRGILILIAAIPLLLYTTRRTIKSFGNIIQFNHNQLTYKTHQKKGTLNYSDIISMNLIHNNDYQITTSPDKQNGIHIVLSNYKNRRQTIHTFDHLKNNILQSPDNILIRTSRTNPTLRNPKWKSAILALLYIAILLQLAYPTYCYIHNKNHPIDYLARFNNINADPTQTQNAWPYYRKAYDTYHKCDESTDTLIYEIIDNPQHPITDQQKSDLKNWYSNNTNTYQLFAQAAQIDYCHPTYDYLYEEDNSTPSAGYSVGDNQIIDIFSFYKTITSATITNSIDLNWLDLFHTQLKSSYHLTQDQLGIVQCTGYALLNQNTTLLANQSSYTKAQLNTIRTMLTTTYPNSIPAGNFNAAIILQASAYDSVLNKLSEHEWQKVLTSSKFYLLLGTRQDNYNFIKTIYDQRLRDLKNGQTEFQTPFSINPFRKLSYMGITAVDALYKSNRKAQTYLTAMHLILDLEDYYLTHNQYPKSLDDLPLSPTTEHQLSLINPSLKPIYQNDNSLAILYTNIKKDTDPRARKFNKKKIPSSHEEKNIYWQRTLTSDKIISSDNENQNL